MQVLRVLWSARGEALRAATRASNRLNKYGTGYAGSQSAVAAKRSAGALHNISSRQVKNISALTPDRSPNLGLVRVIERAIKEAKADLRPSDWE